jgi:lysyl endopeptidase
MKLFIRMIVSFFSIFLLVFASYGQISHGGSPFSFSLQSKSVISPQIPVIEMPFVDVDYLKTEDLVLDQIKEIPWRFGFNIDVKIDVKSHGLEQSLTDGSKLWSVEIYSPGAVSINLLFDEFQIPPGAELFIYNESKTDVIGAFTAFNNRSDSIFATIPLRGDHITIEYYEPANPIFSGVLHLGRVTHGYRGPHDFAKAFGSSGSCNVNVACPESAGMEDQIRSAAMLVSGGNGFCSGALINNTSNNGTPYFLTADHCYTNPSGVVFWFNWQSATCSNPPSSPSYQSISGATTRARYSTSDMWLMELSSSPPSNYNVYYSGWNRTMDNNISGKIWGIHHPAGDIKKISWSTLGVSTTTYLQNPVPGDGSHWRVTQWSDGTTTEGGSSGSPLFDPNGRIIGQLHGGYASCSSLTSDWYGKLGVSWTGGGTNATRLSNWLDPTNSGVTTLDGYDPNYVACSPPSNQTSGFSTSAVNDNDMTLNWTRGNGTSVMVVAREASYVNLNPTNGVNYTANSVFGTGSEIGSGNFVVYKGTGTSVTVTNLQPGITYHYALYEFFTADNCFLTPGLTANVTTTGQAPCTYCTVSASTDDNTGVTRVQFNTIDNISAGAPAYTDFTNISTSVTVGQSYNLSVRVNTDGNYTVQTRAWIDWNQNCIFESGEEYILGSAANVTNGLTSLSPLSITVPAGALTGQTTMRIRAVYGTTAIPAPCGNQNWSEAEDYTLIVVTPCHNTVDYSGITINDYVWDGSVSVNWGTTANWRQYNGTGFVLPTAIPAAGNNVFIRDNGTLCTSHFPVLSDDAEITNLTIQSGASLDINPAKHLKLNGLLSVEGSITLKSNSSGTATIYDNGNISGNGIFNVEQYLPATISPARFWYMTPPVSNALSSVFNAANSTNNKVWSWNESTGTYTQITNNSTSLNPAQGYVLRLMTAPDTLLTFTGGRFNTGNTNIQLTRTDPGHVRRGYNLVGNPYPSFIDLNLISNTDVAKTVWYRSVIGGVMVFPTYNTQSGVGVLGGSRYAHPMQSFWVFLPDDNGNSYNSTLTFSNSMRVSHQGTLLKTTHSGNNILRINIEGNSSYDELVILFHSDAGVGFDNWDSEKMMNTSPSVPQLWTKESGRNLVINSMPEIIDTIPLYMTSQQAGQYIIDINMDEFDPNIDVWLQDLALGTMHNIRNGPYSFSSGVAEDNNRFVLHFSNVITGISNVNENNTSVIVFANENTIYVHTPEKGIIEVYDMVGRLVAKQNAVEGNNNVVIDDANGVFLVRVTKGHEATIKKVALW